MRAIIVAAVLAITYFQAGAQARFSAGITGAGVMSFSSVHPEDIGSGSFRLSPMVTASGGVLVRYQIREWFIETGYQRTGVGFRPQLFLESVGDIKFPITAKAGFSVSEVPLQLRVVLPRPLCGNWRVYLLAGGSLQFKTDKVELLSGSSATITHPSTIALNDSGSIQLSVSFKSAVVASTSIGAGGEKTLRNGGRIYVGAIANRGIGELLTGNIEYTTQGKTYRQRLINRGSYAALQLSYFFPPFGYKKQFEE